MCFLFSFTAMRFEASRERLFHNNNYWVCEHIYRFFKINILLFYANCSAISLTIIVPVCAQLIEGTRKEKKKPLGKYLYEIPFLKNKWMSMPIISWHPSKMADGIKWLWHPVFYTNTFRIASTMSPSAVDMAKYVKAAWGQVGFAIERSEEVHCPNVYGC